MKVRIAPGHLALQEGQDWRVTGNVLSCVFFFLLLLLLLFFCLLLFIDRFIVLSFGMGLET